MCFWLSAVGRKNNTKLLLVLGVYTHYSFARGGGATNSTCLRKGRMTATVPTTTTKDDSDVNEMKKKRRFHSRT